MQKCLLSKTWIYFSPSSGQTFLNSCIWYFIQCHNLLSVLKEASPIIVVPALRWFCLKDALLYQVKRQRL